MSKKRKSSALYLSRGALIASLYVALTHLSAAFGLASGVIQFRLSEILCILPVFLPEAIPGLFIGCLVSNLTTGGVVWDIVLGSLATLLGALGTRLLRKLPKELIWLASLPPIISNAIIVPFVLTYAYGAKEAYFFLLLTVGVGELVCAGIGGMLLYYSLKKSKIRF